MDDTVAADAADAAGGRFDVYIPHELVCPIMGDFMEDPVVAEDGRSYERDMIAAWFAQCTASGQPCTSPVTREPMGSRLVENGTLKRTISELREQQSRQANLTSKGSPRQAPLQHLRRGEAGAQTAVVHQQQLHPHQSPSYSLSAEREA